MIALHCKALAIAVALALTTVPVTAAQVPAGDPCRAAGEGRFASAHRHRCEGTWVIYASLPDGETWWHDKDGNDLRAAQTRRKAFALRTRLLRCGVASFESLSDWFDRFTPGLVVVHSRPFASAEGARSELGRARRCGVNGYAKFSEHAIVGRD